ncbi:cupin-like domain-containing protein [Actinocrispum wychmicini]|uniref:Cupin-like protein n=1 Tax=Actinocrispum wychmicini TaxID=1213861 RepID=A0A4R2JK76_9PSEU|nr:cupin-like domain-containing protein [Actinocrispum wychmicini]TCO59554.1 cupin-like protein [Actinocrispum wychmicini]
MTWDSVDRVGPIDRADFYGGFVAKGRPVVMEKLTAEWRALEWGPDFFRRIGHSTRLAIKQGDVADGRRESLPLADYIDALVEHEARVQAGQPVQRPGYLHDVPLFRFFPALLADVTPFPLHLLPDWYRPNWSEYTQHFMGPTGSVTPLHFDTLLTNNLFFHLSGRKQFTLIPAEQRDLCYPRGWRWARFDPTAPDFETFPLAAQVSPVTVVLEPGDVLYMPPGTLHHVANLSLSVSFNIDWHTADSARRGLASVLHGAPWKNGYYNLLSYLGLRLGVPERLVFRFYRSYLTYVS